MAFVSAIKTDVRNEIIRILQQDIPYQTDPNDLGAPIDPSAIVFQKTRVTKNREDVQENQLTDMPGLIVSHPLRTMIPPDEGEVGRDLWHYYWLVQLVDKDDWSDSDRENSWNKWLEQICSMFMFHCLNGVVQLPQGMVQCVVAHIVQDIDETRWVKEGNFIAGIELHVRVRQPRGVIV